MTLTRNRGPNSTIACALISALSCMASHAAVRYVNHAATGRNDGSSWEDAYTSLHDALSDAKGLEFRINIAAGVYRPSNADDFYQRTRAFTITNRVYIYGGYSQDESGAWVRNVDGTPTILDGDLLGDDGPNFTNRSDNSIHVIQQRSGPGELWAYTQFHGLYIRGGNADGLGDSSEGGGIFCNAGYLWLIGCRVYDNQALWRGGGLSANWGAGGAICERTIFAGNDAPNGSAYCGVAAEFANCVLAGNGAHSGGAAITSMAQRRSSMFRGCTFVGNPSGALSLEGLEHTWTDVVLSSILWNNGPLPINTTRPISITYSDFQGGHTGEGNIDADPRFVDALGPDGAAGTLDDNYRLAADSPCINAGTEFTGLGFNDPFRIKHCVPDMGAYESEYFPDCDASGISDDCELRDDPGLDANGDGQLDRCDSPPPGPNGNANDDRAEPPPGSNGNENENGADPPDSPDNTNGGDSEPPPSFDESGLDVGFPPCSTPVALASALLLTIHLRCSSRRRCRRSAAGDRQSKFSGAD